MWHHRVWRVIGLRADGVVEDDEPRVGLGDLAQLRERFALAIESIEGVEHVDDVEGTADRARDVEHVANMEPDLRPGHARILDRFGVAIDSLDVAPSIAAQVVGAAAAPATYVKRPLVWIFRDRAKGAINRLLLAGMRVVAVANQREDALAFE